MGVSSSDYTTSKFTLRDQEAVDHIQRLVELLRDEENHYGGYYFDNHYIDMYESGGDLTFKIQTGGYADSSPELLRSAVDETEEEDYGDPVSLFEEIQRNLKEGTYYAVMCSESDKSGLYYYTHLFHADGRTEFMSSHNVEDLLLKKMGIEE